ncbi:MAG: hypothetical protein KF705_16110 [Phycisphaeraceae bacterium]|nr:hypothetical protein [Phycisphaeraceae bacterium]
MSAITRQSDLLFAVTDWEPSVTQLMDESHLVAWSDAPRRRSQFAAALGQFLGSMRDTEVCSLMGEHITDLDSFCDQLERLVPGPTLERKIDGSRGVTALLRHRHTLRGRPASKFRYYIWNDADALLKRNHRLFGRLVDAMAGIAAESEYASDDLLLIHRVVLLGGPSLDMYAEDPSGQCRAWFSEQDAEPFWRIVTGLEAPAFLRYQIDLLARE